MKKFTYNLQTIKLFFFKFWNCNKSSLFVLSCRGMWQTWDSRYSCCRWTNSCERKLAMANTYAVQRSSSMWGDARRSTMGCNCCSLYLYEGMGCQKLQNQVGFYLLRHLFWLGVSYLVCLTTLNVTDVTSISPPKK